MRVDLSSLTEESIKALDDDQFKKLIQSVAGTLTEDTRQNQIRYYKPASERARQVHFSRKKNVGCSGGNRSSKTETVLAHIVMQATGIWPSEEDDPELNKEMKAQFLGPINVRIVVESFTTTLYPTILPKLIYSSWVGADKQGGKRGHWGWIPKKCLILGSWDKSWQDKTKTLSINCYDPDSGEILGKSLIQFMSKDQDSTDFASGSFHIVMHDEPPLHAQWVENQARTMDVGGRMFLAFTWHDDPSVPIDWVHDELYSKAGDADHDWFELYTTDNVMLNQESVAQTAREWSEEMKRVRLYGGSMRFSNRVHPLFTDVRMDWCFTCNKSVMVLEGKCEGCKGEDHVSYNHVQHIEYMNWPVVWLLDPHPRKPHMFMWVEITPSDDYRVLADGELADTPKAVAKQVLDFEEERGFRVALRLIDPNMGRSPSGVNREITWQDEFDSVGLMTELPGDSSVGRKRVDEYLKPDRGTHIPRIVVSESCETRTIKQMKRYVWADFKTALEKDIKQTPRDKNDDYPTLLKYLVNYLPEFRFLNEGAPVIKRPGTRGKGGY